MSTKVQFRRGNTESIATFTGAVAELVVDTTANTVVVQDGVTQGGHYLVNAEQFTSNITSVSGTTQQAFDKANGAYDQANTATNLAQEAFNKANTATDSIIQIEGVNNTQNTQLLGIFGVNDTQNTRISTVENYSQYAFDKANAANGLAQSAYDAANAASSSAFVQAIANTANSASANTVYTQGVDLTQNAAISIIQGVDLSQNTAIAAVDSYAHSAYGLANTNAGLISIIQGVDLGQNAAISVIQGVDNTQNTRLDVIEGTNVTQNTRINSIETINNNQNTSIGIIQGVDATQNTRLDIIEGTDASQNTRMSIIEGVDATQNTRLSGIEGVNLSQNTAITAVDNFAQSAYNSANNKFSSSGGTISGDTVITGNLSVTGTTFYANVTNVVIEDNILVLNSNVTGTPTHDAGLLVNRGNQANTSLIWSESNKVWQITNDGTNYAEIATVPELSSNVSYLQGVNLTQNTNITAVDNYAHSAYAQANTNAGSITVIQGVDNSQNTRMSVIEGVDLGQNTAITAVDNFAHSAYDKANSATTLAQNAYNTANTKLNSSGGTISGNLTVTGYANVNQTLVVGQGAPAILPNLIGQFTGSSSTYTQVNNQNTDGDGTADLVVTANNGTDLINYIDLGMAGSTYKNTNYNSWTFVNPNDGYLMVEGNAGQSFGGNLYVGTAGSGSTGNEIGDIVFIQGPNTTEVARFGLNQGLTTIT